MGAARPVRVSRRISQEKSDIEIDRDTIRARQRLQGYAADGKGTTRIPGAILLKLVGNERLIFRTGIIPLNCLIEVSHHFIEIVSLHVAIERSDKILGFRLCDRSRRGSTERGRSESDASQDHNCDENSKRFSQGADYPLIKVKYYAIEKSEKPVSLWTASECVDQSGNISAQLTGGSFE